MYLDFKAPGKQFIGFRSDCPLKVGFETQNIISFGRDSQLKVGFENSV